ncbi:MAG: HNH endonuclease [Pirellulaceae bacterium]|nr:HNH endonuclease [Pirellulaceae bacterium]
MSRTYIPAEVRRLVRERARERCEYCLIPESAVFVSHEVDHIVAEKHGGETETNNLALSCVLCNKHKGSDLTSIDPSTSDIVPLFHPRRNSWTEHFHVVDGRIEPLTATGRVTARLLQHNHPDRIEERELLLAAGLIQPPEA